MSIDKYICFMQYMFIISETIITEREEWANSNRCFSKILISIRHIKKKKKYQVPITSLYLHWAIY